MGMGMSLRCITLSVLRTQLMETVVQVLVKDHASTIVAECPRLIANNDVESRWQLHVQHVGVHAVDL